ncbi:MAG: DUF1080 domain-containing protein [Verrucomicrobiales bacterium]|nr:DUF1080 domain-containing protein [Verrucomicrobiales bacterium]
MIRPFLCALLGTFTVCAAPIALFDGKTFTGWDGDTNRIWRIDDGALVAGDLKSMVPRNEFVATTRSYTNFVLRAQFKIEGSEGFVNGGIQIRSQRIPNHNEMIGYQADIGEGWYGCLYDESRRNTVLARPDAAAVAKAFKAGEWNDYEIRCEGSRVRLWINGVPMVDYVEKDPAIVPSGRIGLQVHGGGKTRISFRKLTLEELP